MVSLGIGVLVLLRGVAGYVTGVLSARLQVRVLVRLRESLARALYRSHYADVTALGPGKLVNLFSLQADRVVGGVSAAVTLLHATLLLGVYGLALLIISWRLSLAAAALGAAGFAVAAYATRRIRAHSSRVAQAEEESSRLVLDDAAGLHVIQAYDIPAERLALHRQVNERLYRETLGLYRWRLAARPITDLLYTLTLLAGVWVALTVAPDRLFASVPLILAFAFVLIRVQGQVGAIVDGAAFLAEQEGMTFNVFEFLRDRVAVEPRVLVELRSPIEQIRVKDVAFRYPEGQPVLQGIDLELHRGEVLAVVGSSGAGKSTLAQLLARLRTPDAGRIALDGVPLELVTRDSLARNVAVSFEDCFIFDETIEWNISLGRQVAERELREAARVAQLDPVIDAHPDGFRSRVGPRGATLSAGQRQRVALARAIITRPPVLILDEATNALDGLTELSVTEALRSLRPEGITLIVAHRLGTILSADRIAVLDQGRIVASGTHGELMQKSPVYRRLVETQLIASDTVLDH
jgi:subfamily B ATP-binding cassette protein MsbA